MATALEIIRGISQAAANYYDGAHDERYTHDGEARKAGLKREEGDVVLDSRTMDGFKVSFHGNVLRVKYQSELKLKETHDKNFESDIEQTIADIASYLKREYKKVTGRVLSLTPQDSPNILVQSMSNIRSWVQAQQDFKIGKLTGVEPASILTDDPLRQATKDFLALGKKQYPGTKDPFNVKRKGDQ